jgi:hypothetical protein
VQDNYVIQAVAAETPDEPFDVRILPWTPWSNHYFFDAHVSHPLPKQDVIDAVPIAQQIPWGFVPGEGIYDLLSGPFRCRMLRDVEVDDATSMVGQDEQHEEHFVCHRRHDKEIKGDQVLDMVVQKGLPRRRRWLQKRLRCQAITVRGWTNARTLGQPGQSWDNHAQSTRSVDRRHGRSTVCL